MVGIGFGKKRLPCDGRSRRAHAAAVLQLCELLVEMLERGFQLSPPPRMHSACQISLDAVSHQLKIISFAPSLLLFLSLPRPARLSLRARVFDLLFHGFTFPTSRHALSVAQIGLVQRGWPQKCEPLLTMV